MEGLGAAGRGSGPALGSRGLRRRAVPLVGLLLLTASLALAARAEAFVYWAHPGDVNGSPAGIARANLDGSGVEESFIPDAGGACGVAVDSAHVYWGSGPSIARANLDGTGVDLNFITLEFDRSICGVGLDGAHVYWSEVRGFGFGAPSIARANLDGSGVDENFIIDSWGGCGLAVDGAHIYWSNTRGVGAGGRGSIARANLDGTGVDQNFIPVFTNEFFDYPCGVAVDREHVYWAWLNSALEGAGSIGRANLDGTAVDQDFIPYEGLRPSCGIALHGARIYWGGGSIARANLDGTELENIIPLDSSTCSVAVDGLSSPPPPPQSPSNEFSFGKLKKNKQSGTAKLTVEVPGPGELELAKTNGVKADEQTAEAAGDQKLIVRSRLDAKKKLNSDGKAKVNPKVTFTPDGGEPRTERKRIKLIKR